MVNSAPQLKSDFSYLDQDDFQSRYAVGSVTKRITFHVGGIRCAKCVRKIEALPASLPGLRNITVEFGKNLAHAEVDSQTLPFSILADKITSLGFEVTPLSKETDEFAIQRSSDRRDLIRLGVAGACAGNIMTFSFATYLGETGEFFKLFAWLSFALYLPVVTYVALPFYRGAWRSLRDRQISIDLPMAVASLAGFIFSTVELLRGKTDLYFDSLSGFLFLILVSRWFQQRLQRKYLRPEEMGVTFGLEKSRRLTSGVWTWCPTDRLAQGDRIRLNYGETVPADAQLETLGVRFGTAWLSGEEKAKSYSCGAIIPAGAKLDSREAELIVIKPLSETHFGRILADVNKQSLSHVKIASVADKWAQWLLAGVFTSALAFLFWYWPQSHEDAIQRSLALIILACPCALAFGTPLALASGLRRAKKNGLVVRNANVFEDVNGVRTIFFDKTGTITDTDLALIETFAAIPEIYQRILLTLENDSVHPIAFALRKAFQNPAVVLPTDNWREVPGRGVSGFIYGRLYELRGTSASSKKASCALYEDGLEIYRFEFDSLIKADSLVVLETLRSRGMKIVLLSGDKKSAVDQLVERLGFKFDEIYSEMDPAQKAEVVAKTPGAMVVGDGINDSLAMMKAHVSVAVSGGVEAALRSADVFLTSPDLSGILELFGLSKSTFGLIKRNLCISFVYNIAAGILALLGFVNPMVAAILMPISSGIILLNTWWGGRN